MGLRRRLIHEIDARAKRRRADPIVEVRADGDRDRVLGPHAADHADVSLCGRWTAHVIDIVAEDADRLGHQLELLGLAVQRQERRHLDGRADSPHELVAHDLIGDLHLVAAQPDAAGRREHDPVTGVDAGDAHPGGRPARVARKVVVVTGRHGELAAQEHRDPVTVRDP